jgi:nucleoside-diphosphate-sugar epimerase
VPISQDEARAVKNAYYWYCSGKKEAELAIWDFVKTTTPAPKFTVTVFLPALIFGPPINPVKNVKSLNYSTNVIYGLFNGTNATVPPTTFPSYIDVRDLADAHVKALTNPAVQNKRLPISGRSVTYTALVHALSKVPELAGRLPGESGEDANVVPAAIDAEEANKALDMTFRTLEETMADTAKKILEIEKLE